MAPRRTLATALAAATVALTACGGGASRLQGTWKGLRADGVPAETQARANDFAMTMQLEVKGDTLTIKTGSDTQVTKFKVVDGSKSTVVVETDKDAAGGPHERETFTFIDDKTMKWNVAGGAAGGRTITFVKQ